MLNIVFPTDLYNHKRNDLLLKFKKLNNLNTELNIHITLNRNYFINKFGFSSDCFKFYNSLTRKELMNLLNKSDAVLILSEIESYGLIALEANINKKPIIAPPYPWLKELIGNSFYDIGNDINNLELQLNKLNSDILNNSILLPSLQFEYLSNNEVSSFLYELGMSII